MRRNWAITMRSLVFAFIVCICFSCQKEYDAPGKDGCEEMTVGFYAGGPLTRSSMLSNGLSAQWTGNDRIALWAATSSGTYAFSNKEFVLYGSDVASGFFTSTISSAMADGVYTYYAVYPVPSSVNGTKVQFALSDQQDGKASDGADIMISGPVEGGALKPLAETSSQGAMSMAMHHVMHQFRFFVPGGEDILGEPIEKLVLTFPRDVVGTVTADYTDPSAVPTLSSGKHIVSLNLKEKLKASTSSQTYYACVAICPTTFSLGESLAIRAYSATKSADADQVDLKGRTFQAGHSTPVRLVLSGVKEFCRLKLTLTSNNLGEDVNSISLTAPDGCTWPDGSTVYTYNPGRALSLGENFEISFEDASQFRAMSGKTVKATFDSEHVAATVSYAIEDLSSKSESSLYLSAPYLLNENFSSVPTFSSNDGYTSGSNAGSKSAHSFLDGWTAGRAGASSGQCVRIAARRETSARYPARVDSAPIISLKKAADIVVSFDYGADNKYGGIGSGGNLGQDVSVGYVTATTAYASGDDDGTFESGNGFYVKANTGSYTSTPNHDEYILHSVPAGTVRISWRSEVESNAGLTNTTTWFYLDNVKVQIAQ